MAKLRDGIAQAKANLAAENARMAAEQAVLDAQAQRIQADSYRLRVDQNASHKVLMRKHRSRFPLVYESRDLFNTPGAGASNPPMVNRMTEVPGGGVSGQPCVTSSLYINNTPPQHVVTPPGHYSTPLDNMIAAATRLAALPVNGETPTAVETRRARELL